MSWWNSLSTVTNLNYTVGFLTALLAIATFIFGMRKDTLANVESDATNKAHREAIAKADARAAEANQQAQQAIAETAKVNLARVETEKQLETLRRESIKMLYEIGPRTYKDQGSSGERLTRFAPVKVAILFVPEDECQQTAGQI